MIQRIQSLYLLAVTILLVLTLCFPLGYFHGANGLEEATFRALGVTAAGGAYQTTWGLFCILLLSAVVSLATIFLFRNRMLQIRMVIFSSLLLIGFYIVFGIFYYMLSDTFTNGFGVGIALCLPLVSLILNYLAFRAIYKDEALVNSLNHLRP